MRNQSPVPLLLTFVDLGSSARGGVLELPPGAERLGYRTDLSKVVSLAPGLNEALQQVTSAVAWVRSALADAATVADIRYLSPDGAPREELMELLLRGLDALASGRHTVSLSFTPGPGPDPGHEPDQGRLEDLREFLDARRRDRWRGFHIDLSGRGGGGGGTGDGDETSGGPVLPDVLREAGQIESGTKGFHTPGGADTTIPGLPGTVPGGSGILVLTAGTAPLSSRPRAILAAAVGYLVLMPAQDGVTIERWIWKAGEAWPRAGFQVWGVSWLDIERDLGGLAPVSESRCDWKGFSSTPSSFERRSAPTETVHLRIWWEAGELHSRVTEEPVRYFRASYEGTFELYLVVRRPFIGERHALTWMAPSSALEGTERLVIDPGRCIVFEEWPSTDEVAGLCEGIP